jgi:hypothetical protein
VKARAVAEVAAEALGPLLVQVAAAGEDQIGALPRAPGL